MRTIAAAKKKEVIAGLIESARKFRFCGPSDDPDEQTHVTAGYRYLIIQFKRLAGPFLPQAAASQLDAIDVEVDNLYSAFDAKAELDALLPDIEAALEAVDDDEKSHGFTMPMEQPFSKRHRYSGGAKEITIREDAPENLRYFTLETAVELGWGPYSLRDILCRVLRVPPDPSNWSEYPNVWGEVQGLMYGCDWFKIYDIIEALHASMVKNDRNALSKHAPQFAEALNEFFIDEGIGWQLVNGQIVTRGTEAFEGVVTQAASALEATERPTAAKHLHEALQDLSRRPQAGFARRGLSRDGFPGMRGARPRRR
jgi:AbiJ N-terminal domain 4